MLGEPTRTRTVISLGGSLIFPGDDIDVAFVTRFRALMLAEVARGRQFAVVVGGGKFTRKYQAALGEVVGASDEAKDWMGVYATHLNARFISLVFGRSGSASIITDPHAEISSEEPVLIAGGWKPGWSTDYDAVVLAKNLGAMRVLNLSNVSHVYDADPKTHPNAQPRPRLSWDEYLPLIPDAWQPGLNTPFDPVAAKEAREHGLEVVVLGADLENLTLCLQDKPFEGTVIHP